MSGAARLPALKTGIYKLKDFINCIKVKRNNFLNSIYSSVSPDFRFKETPYVNFFTDPELSSSLYMCCLRSQFWPMGIRIKGNADLSFGSIVGPYLPLLKKCGNWLTGEFSFIFFYKIFLKI